MDRLTKLTLTAWTFAAIAFQTWMLRSSWTELPLLVFLALTIAGVTCWLDRRAIAIVLMTTYVHPVLVLWGHGALSPDYDIIWIAGVFGAIVPDLIQTPWRMPLRWRRPLVCAGLVLAVALPLVLSRETDGHIPLLLGSTPPFWSAEPWFVARWSMHVALTLMVGLLLFESLFAGDVDVEQTIVPSLAGSALVMGSVAVYQRFIDAHFLNGTMFEALGRATGTMYDANVMGTAAALWLGGVSLWAARRPQSRLVVAVPAVIVLFIAVWASGSRTSLVAALIALAGVGIYLSFREGRLVPARILSAVAIVAVLAGAGVVYGIAHRGGSNPMSRLGDLVAANPTPVRLLSEIWNRNGYGTIATQLILESPWAGVGVGLFHGLSLDVSGRLGRPIAPDNAQNWLRHQVAEFGVIGASGWIVWVVSFAAFLCWPKRGEPSRIWIARGTLIAFGLISLVGMPGQDPMVALAFWVLAYWYCRLSANVASTVPTERWTWSSIAAVVALFAFTSTSAAGTLRPAERARRSHKGYGYGIGPVSNDAPHAGYRPIDRDVTVLDYPGLPWMTISVRRDAASADPTPVEIRAWVDGHVVFKAQLAAGAEFSTPVRVMPGGILLETEVRRPSDRWRPSPPLQTDVWMRWEFSPNAPAGTREYERPSRR